MRSPPGRVDPAPGDPDPGAGRAVVDRVLDEVAESCGELATVAPDVQVRGGSGGHGDLFGVGLVPAAVDRLRDQVVHGDGLGVVEQVVVLDPGEVDDLLHEAGQAGGLDLHPAGETVYRLGVVGGVHDGLREQRERADGGLQLMAHVRHEVPAYRLDPPGLGEVLDQQQHQPGAQRRDPGGDRQALAAPGTTAWQVQFHLPYLAVPPGLAGHLQHLVDGQPAAAYQPEGVCGGAGLHHCVTLVEDDSRRAQHREHGVHARRQYRVGVQGGARGAGLFPLAPAEREHGDHTGQQTGDRTGCGDCRVHVHAPG